MISFLSKINHDTVRIKDSEIELCAKFVSYYNISKH